MKIGDDDSIAAPSDFESFKNLSDNSPTGYEDTLKTYNPEKPKKSKKKAKPAFKSRMKVIQERDEMLEDSRASPMKNYNKDIF